jgi:hypothetical protein
VCGWLLHCKSIFSDLATVGQYSRVSGLFMWRFSLPLALMSSASKVPIG